MTIFHVIRHCCHYDTVTRLTSIAYNDIHKVNYLHNEIVACERNKKSNRKSSKICTPRPGKIMILFCIIYYVIRTKELKSILYFILYLKTTVHIIIFRSDYNRIVLLFHIRAMKGKQITNKVQYKLLSVKIIRILNNANYVTNTKILTTYTIP